MARYLIYDVFTDRAFGGNPLAVFPDAAPIPPDLFPVIAREFNLSETVFVLPPDAATEDGTAHRARLRIFTPAAELPFAGHPLIGTAVALADAGHGPDLVFDLGVGPISAHARDGAARFVTRVPLSVGPPRSRRRIAACIGLQPEDVTDATHPPQTASLGSAFTMIEVVSLSALGRASPDLAAFRAAASEDRDGALATAIMAWCRDGDGLRARMFAPLGGILEDPATGSAAAALAALLAERRGTGGPLSIRQGIEMGRPSLIDTDVTLRDGRTAAVAVSGRAVRVAEGTLLLG